MANSVQLYLAPLDDEFALPLFATLELDTECSRADRRVEQTYDTAILSVLGQSHLTSLKCIDPLPSLVKMDL